MDAGRWARIEQILDAAMDLEGPARDAHLKRACAGNAALMASVRALLDAESASVGFLETPAAERAGELVARFAAAPLEADAVDAALPQPAGVVHPSGTAHPPPPSIPGYAIVGEIGRGGMGVVYEAWQEHPARAVAVKVISTGPAGDPYQVRLFDREVQSLARLRHPGIAAIYASGTTGDGRRYFAMELVTGTRLDVYLAEHPLDAPRLKAGLAERLALFLEICDAIAYAHQRGVIHRDLKPSNIIVVSDEATPTVAATSGAPSASGGSSRLSARPQRVKVLDFGLARITDEERGAGSLVTEVGRVQGTLASMSPEQARGDPEAVDLRSDVWALGVVLYEMLTGHGPFALERLPLHEAVRTICESQPLRPSATHRSLRGDLETIVLKALAKEPALRYASAAALADDIRRYCADQPVLARAPSTTYQLRKLVARHRVAVTSLLVLAVLLVAFGATMSVMFGIQRRERARAELEAQKARRISQFMGRVIRTAAPEQSGGRAVTVAEVLEQSARLADGELSDQPEVLAAVRASIGEAYMSMADYERAEPLLRAALATRDSLLPPDHHDVVESLNDLGTVLQRRNQLAEAEALFRRAVAAARHHEHDEPEFLARALNNLTVVLSARGRYAQADSISRETLVVAERSLAADGAWMADILAQRAQVVGHLGRSAESDSLVRASLALQRRAYGGDHPLLATNLNNLAVSLASQQQFAEAEAVHREALAMRQRLFGPTHPAVATSMANLGQLLRQQQRYAEAESLMTRALAIRTQALGPEHDDVANSINGLGLLLLDEGKPEQAEQRFRAALAIRRNVYGSEHPQVATILSNLGRALAAQRRYADADAAYQQALAMRIKLLGAAHPDVARLRERIAELHSQWGRGAAAAH